MAINDKFPPWWDFVMVGICRKAIIIIIIIAVVIITIAKDVVIIIVIISRFNQNNYL